jgi:hypothetical protein
VIDFLLSPWTIFGAGITVTAIFAAAWFFLPGILPAFLATKLGQRVALIGGVIAALWFAFVAVAKRSEWKGARKVKDQIARDSIEKNQQRELRDAELKNLDDDALRKRSDRWLRP